MHDLPGDGRAFNTDVDGGFNLFQNNIATNVAIGFSDQMAGWGNTWVGNRASKYRTCSASGSRRDFADAVAEQQHEYVHDQQ